VVDGEDGEDVTVAKVAGIGLIGVGVPPGAVIFRS
jgi:hypothetical protein